MQDIKGRHCGWCRKEFYPTPQWVYKKREVYFCSWGCMRKYQAAKAKRKAETKQTKKRVTPAERGQILKMLRKGFPVTEICEHVGVTDNAVRYYKKRLDRFPEE